MILLQLIKNVNLIHLTTLMMSIFMNLKFDGIFGIDILNYFGAIIELNKNEILFKKANYAIPMYK